MLGAEMDQLVLGEQPDRVLIDRDDGWRQLVELHACHLHHLAGDGVDLDDITRVARRHGRSREPLEPDPSATRRHVGSSYPGRGHLTRRRGDLDEIEGGLTPDDDRVVELSEPYGVTVQCGALDE